MKNKTLLFLKSSPILLAPISIIPVVSCSKVDDILNQALNEEININPTTEGLSLNPTTIINNIENEILSGAGRTKIINLVQSYISWRKQIGSGAKTVSVNFNPNIRQFEKFFYIDETNPTIINIQLEFSIKGKTKTKWYQVEWPVETQEQFENKVNALPELKLQSWVDSTIPASAVKVENVREYVEGLPVSEKDFIVEIQEVTPNTAEGSITVRVLYRNANGNLRSERTYKVLGFKIEN